MSRALSLPFVLAALLAACSEPTPPDPERPPVPKATSSSAAPASPITATANVYKDAARDAVDKTQAQAAEQARAAEQAAQ
ncbi:hypothetical protein LJB71_02480 [Thermomonas sp. S9]|uniref:hypothetical protein n=1 Tax=Thermomonas sp. S9 TaxID=2885203 RepID=UPI00216B4302|nr:hypothetical protein [Thermomonas sp. S9]MCR6495218.1 hypothetical protein [Thermomonas sp. S9]